MSARLGDFFSARSGAAAGAAAAALYLGWRLVQDPAAQRGRSVRTKLQYGAAEPLRRSRDGGGFPPPYPNGWYYLCAATDLGREAVLTFHFIGRELVAFREASGKVGVVSAFCPHQGVHIGYGGFVDGDGVRCPYHHWKFGTDGKLKHVPQLEDGGARDCERERNHLQSFPVSEFGGLIFCWVHADGEAPLHPPEETFMKPIKDHGMAYTTSLRMEDMAMHIMEPSHNSVDWYHFTTVHKKLAMHWLDKLAPLHATYKTEPARAAGYGSKDDTGSPLKDPQLLIFDQAVTSVKVFDVLPLPTHTIPDLQRTTFYGPQNMATHLHIPGVGNFLMLLLMVPVAPFKTEMQLHAYTENWWTRPAAYILLRFLRATLYQDREIWEHKIMHKTRNSVKGDWSWMGYDKWLRQFYSRSSQVWSDDLTW